VVDLDADTRRPRDPRLPPPPGGATGRHDGRARSRDPGRMEPQGRQREAVTSRILVVRFGSLGDVVLSFAACQSLARARPDRSLSYLVKEAYAPLVAAQPWVGEVFVLPDRERG